MNVHNSRGALVRLYSALNEAVNTEVVEPIQVGLDRGEDARGMFDVDAIADKVIEWHSEYDDNGNELLNYSGFCCCLGADDPDEFWDIARGHQH